MPDGIQGHLTWVTCGDVYIWLWHRINKAGDLSDIHSDVIVSQIAFVFQSFVNSFEQIMFCVICI